MAEEPKRKPTTKTKLTDKEQSERFKATARELGVKENEDFERIFTKIVPPKRRSPIRPDK
jgi:hypothetical protein